MILAVMSCDISILLNNFESFRNLKDSIKNKFCKKLRVADDSGVSAQEIQNKTDLSAVSEELTEIENSEKTRNSEIIPEKDEHLDENNIFSDYNQNDSPENNKYSIPGLTPSKSKSRVYKTLNARKMLNSNYQKRKERNYYELYNT